MSIKHLISLLLLTGVVASGCGPLMALAHTADAAEADSVTISDLGIENPGLLPTNPFYFLKEWGRGVRRVFTFNPVTKAELELRIANEKAAEAKQVEETAPENTEAITEAVKNYEAAQARLQTRLELLKETSKNPNVDRLLNELADRTVKHQKLFDELVKKFDESDEVKAAVETAKSRLGEATAAGAGKDDPGKFAAKLENALITSRGGELKHLQSVEIIDQIQKKAPEQVKDSLERLRKNFSERLDEDIKKALEKDGSDKVEKAIRDLPGDAGRRSVILDEIKAAAERRVREVLDAASEKLEAVTRQEKNIAEKAKEQLQRTEEAIKKLEATMKESGSAPGVVSRLLEQARGNFKEALLAFEEGKFGEAFGQARSGEVLARNGLRFLEEERPQADDLKEELSELAAKIERYEQFLREKGYNPEKNPKAYSLLEEARKHLRFAEEALAKNDREGTKLHIGHVLGYLKDLSRIIEEENRRPPEPVVKPIRPVPAVSAPATKPVSRCEEIKRNLDQLWEMFKAGRINEQDYNLKYEALKKEYVNCEPTAAPKPEPIAEPAAVKPVEPTNTIEPVPVPKTAVESALATTPETLEVKLEADDFGFYPTNIVRARKGSKVKLHFIVRADRVYYVGLDFRSAKFKTPSIKPGGVTSVEFTADESFEFSSYWPASERLKATGKVVVE